LSSCGSATTQSTRFNRHETLQILVSSGIKTRDEARADLN